MWQLHCSFIYTYHDRNQSKCEYTPNIEGLCRRLLFDVFWGRQRFVNRRNACGQLCVCDDECRSKMLPNTLHARRGDCHNQIRPHRIFNGEVPTRHFIVNDKTFIIYIFHNNIECLITHTLNETEGGETHIAILHCVVVYLSTDDDSFGTMFFDLVSYSYLWPLLTTQLQYVISFLWNVVVCVWLDIRTFIFNEVRMHLC